MARTITTDEFGALYRTVAPELFGYLRRRGAIDAEDIVAEVFTIAWDRRARLPAAPLRRAWLFGTTRRLLLAAARHARNAEEVAKHLSATHLTSSAPLNETPSAEHEVLAALARLSPEERELIQLVEWDRLTPAEIAMVFGIRPGTARVRLHRARQSLAADPRMQALVNRASSARSG